MGGNLGDFLMVVINGIDTRSRRDAMSRFNGKNHFIEPPYSRVAACRDRVSKAFVAGCQEDSFANPDAPWRVPTGG